MCFKKLLLILSERRFQGENKDWGKTFAAAFIRHNMRVFAPDGNPSITRGPSDHDGSAAEGVNSDLASGSLQLLKSRKACSPSLVGPPVIPHRGVTGKQKEYEENIKCIA